MINNITRLYFRNYKRLLKCLKNESWPLTIGLSTCSFVAAHCSDPFSRSTRREKHVRSERFKGLHHLDVWKNKYKNKTFFFD